MHEGLGSTGWSYLALKKTGGQGNSSCFLLGGRGAGSWPPVVKVRQGGSSLEEAEAGQDLGGAGQASGHAVPLFLTCSSPGPLPS